MGHRIKMTKENYKAWDINIDSFFFIKEDYEKLKFLLNFAVLAPSSHNTQPWAFQINGKSIDVYKDTKRTLKIADQNDRQSFLSIGCAIENVTIAAEYYGYAVSIQYDLSSDKVATLNFIPGTSDKKNSHLFFSITKRVVNRDKYLLRTIDSLLLNKIKGYSEEGIMINIVEEQSSKDELTKITLDAVSVSMQDKSFRQELSQYVISNNSSSKIGMPGFGLGFPTPISYIAPYLLKKFNMSTLSNKKDESILKTTPYFFVISTKYDNPENWIKAGRIYERIALTAMAEGISTAVWGAPIQIKEYYKEIQEVLHIDYRPQVFFRVGYPQKDVIQHSPRLSIQDVLK